MRTVAISAAFAVVAALAGCAAPKQLSAEERKALEAPQCKDKAECDVMWQAAQVWVANNSKWRIQAVTDSILQTYGPGDSETKLAFSVTKRPIGGTASEIVMKAGCGNMFGCDMEPYQAIINFNNAVRKAAQ